MNSISGFLSEDSLYTAFQHFEVDLLQKKHITTKNTLAITYG